MVKPDWFLENSRLCTGKNLRKTNTLHYEEHCLPGGGIETLLSVIGLAGASDLIGVEEIKLLPKDGAASGCLVGPEKNKVIQLGNCKT